MRYIITGTGRCGTNFLAKLLCSAGVRCGRESVFNLSLRATKKLMADSSWMALPYLEAYPERWREAKIVHLVRNPWDILRGWLFDFESVFSVWKTGKAYRITNYFLVKHCPGLREIESPVEKALYFYGDWNRRIDALRGERSVVRVRAESAGSSILWRLGIDPGDKQLFSNRLENTRKRCVLTREEVDSLLRPKQLYGVFANLAKEYGYESP